MLTNKQVYGVLQLGLLSFLSATDVDVSDEQHLKLNNLFENAQENIKDISDNISDDVAIERVLFALSTLKEWYEEYQALEREDY